MQHVFPEALSARRYLLLSVILDMLWETRSKGCPQEGAVFLAEWVGLSSKCHKKIIFLFLSTLVSLLEVLSGLLNVCKGEQSLASCALALHRLFPSCFSPQRNPSSATQNAPGFPAKTFAAGRLRAHCGSLSPASDMVTKETPGACSYDAPNRRRLPVSQVCVTVRDGLRRVPPNSYTEALTSGPQNVT